MKRLLILLIIPLLPFIANAGKSAKVETSAKTETSAKSEESIKAEKPEIVENAEQNGSGTVPLYYGAGLCKYPQYECIKIKGGQSWTKLFPDEKQRDLVQRINRTYNTLHDGQIIAIPKNLKAINIFDISPFPLKIDPSPDNQIIVDQEKLAWAAYDEQGQLVKWGPISSGSDTCSDRSSHTCRSLTGIFRVFDKQDERCISLAFPAGKGGARMPYCMFIHKGFALHGSDDIPGYRASHGCVRMFIEDAKWLNHVFVKKADKNNKFAGTVVTVRPLYSADKFNKGINQIPTSPRNTRHRD